MFYRENYHTQSVDLESGHSSWTLTVNIKVTAVSVATSIAISVQAEALMLSYCSQPAFFWPESIWLLESCAVIKHDGHVIILKTDRVTHELVHDVELPRVHTSEHRVMPERRERGGCHVEDAGKCSLGTNINHKEKLYIDRTHSPVCQLIRSSIGSRAYYRVPAHFFHWLVPKSLPENNSIHQEDLSQTWPLSGLRVV